MPQRTVSLPGPIHLVPGRDLGPSWDRRRRDHPHLPASLGQVQSDLSAMQAEGGVPATIEAPMEPGRDQSLLIYGRTYVLRLFLLKKRQDGYTVASINPLLLTHHHRLAQGCLLLQPAGWVPAFELRLIPSGASGHWPLILSAWADCARGPAVSSPPGLTTGQAAFLDTLDRVIDADEQINREAASARAFAYREVRPTAEQRRAAYPVYEFQIVGQGPEPETFVQVRGEPEQRGQVTRAMAGAVTIRFDQPVGWDRIPRQGQLEEAFNGVVYRKQREAVDLLRTGQTRNPHLLTVLTDYRTAPIGPAADLPSEDLDEDQLTAFRKAIGVEDMLLILGPPGTGKTRTISQSAQACALGAATRDAGRVLITSHTNRAVDNVLARLPGGLLPIRVGNDGKVTKEGQPYLLESQATDLKGRILNETARALSAYEDLDAAPGWLAELADHLGQLRAVVAAEAQASSGLDAARRAVGGPAQGRLDTLVAEHARRAQTLDRLAHRSDVLARRAARAGTRTGWPLIGAGFGLLERRWLRRLAATEQAASRLRTDQEHTRSGLVEAERELDAATCDQPTVQTARAQVDEAVQRRATARAAALAAALECHDIVRRVDTAPLLTADGDAATTERDLPTLHAWLTQRLPVLAARASLLTEWRRDASGETDQLHPELIRYAGVIAATCIGTASRPELSGVDFDLAIVDEAGQIGVANVLVPLVRARRAVLVGDHQQLPPYLESAVEAWGAGIGDPVITDLLAKSALELLVHQFDQASVVMLTTQRRMPAAIAEFISTAFYQGKLRTGVTREHRDPLFSRPMAFVDTGRLPEAQRYEKSATAHEQWGQRGYINPAEADLLTELAAAHHRRGSEWAVIVPYRAQVAKIATALIRLVGDAELIGLNVGTVDSFQGGERDVILYGFTRSNSGGHVGFLDELRRANVAFTRARRQLVLVGDMHTLTQARDERFRDLACSLRAHLAEHGDIRQYRDVRERLARLEAREAARER
jgi:hypothetical protein